MGDGGAEEGVGGVVVVVASVVGEMIGGDDDIAAMELVLVRVDVVFFVCCCASLFHRKLNSLCDVKRPINRRKEYSGVGVEFVNLRCRKNQCAAQQSVITTEHSGANKEATRPTTTATLGGPKFE